MLAAPQLTTNTSAENVCSVAVHLDHDAGDGRAPGASVSSRTARAFVISVTF